MEIFKSVNFVLVRLDQNWPTRISPQFFIENIEFKAKQHIKLYQAPSQTRIEAKFYKQVYAKGVNAMEQKLTE